MSDDFKRGFIIGTAMQPLCVTTTGGGEEIRENLCVDTVLVGDTMSNDGHCANIEF